VLPYSSYSPALLNCTRVVVAGIRLDITEVPLYSFITVGKNSRFTLPKRGTRVADYKCDPILKQ
jgi:hypothetical protein